MKEKEKKEAAILVIGAVVLIGLIIFSQNRRRATTATAVKARGGIIPSMLVRQAPPPKTEIAAKKIREVRYTGSGNRDPIDNSIAVEPVAPEAAVVEEKKAPAVFPKETLVISAVVWGSVKPQAIINGKLVGIGEAIDGGKIIGIDKKGIHIDFEGQEVLVAIK